MISFVTPLPIGNAVSVGLSPPCGSAQTLILRNTVGTFTGPADASSTVVFRGLDSGFLDFCGLTNGTAYSYGEFNYIDNAWVAGNIVQATPAASETSMAADPLTVVRDRLKAGLAVEVQAQRLQPQSGVIEVYTAPPLFDQTKWPVVSVHLRNDAPSTRALGEDLYGEAFDPIGGSFLGTEGWLSDVQLDIYGWTSNPDVRIALRQAIKRVLISNLPIFDAAGMMQVTFSQSDIEDFETYASPVYQVVTSFSCVAPCVVTASIAEPLSDANAVAALD